MKLNTEDQKTKFVGNENASTGLIDGGFGITPENILALVQVLKQEPNLKSAFLGILGGVDAKKTPTADYPTDNALFQSNIIATLAGSDSLPAVVGKKVENCSDSSNQSVNQSFPQQSPSNPVLAALAQFEAQKPGYFESNPVRIKLRDYLSSNCSHLSKEDILDILSMASGLENQAIQNFKSQNDLDKTIISSNNSAKSKLFTEAARAAASGVYSLPPFTRQQIAAMSLDEYRKNEKEIFNQYKKGLIK